MKLIVSTFLVYKVKKCLLKSGKVKLLAGQGIFAPFGEDVFNDYWMGYFNATDAQKLCWTIPPYSDFETYRQHLIKLSAYSERF